MAFQKLQGKWWSCIDTEKRCNYISHYQKTLDIIIAKLLLDYGAEVDETSQSVGNTLALKDEGKS